MAEFKYSNIEKEMQAYGFDKVIKSQITSIGIFRRQINIQEIKEITLEESQDYLIRELSE